MSKYRDDYREIEAVLNRYATSLDSKQYAGLKDVFTSEVLVNYIGMGVECSGVDSVIELVSGVLNQCGNTQHILSNFRIDVQGDRATASCYLQAIHVGLGDCSDQLLTVWGEYRDELQKTGDGWRISYRELTVIHSEGDIGLE